MMTANCDVIVIFLIYGKFGPFREPDSQSVKLKFSLKVTFYLTKAGNRTKKSLTQLSPIALSKGTIFAKKYCYFCKKMLTSAKLREPWH